MINSDFEVTEIICTEAFFRENSNALSEFKVWQEDDLSTLGNFRSNNKALAVVRMKDNKMFSYNGGMILALDDVNDPGNLGTIIRLADWYGIAGIIASPETCELYNPKVISATKGSFTRVPVYYSRIADVLHSLHIPVFAADMEGDNVHITSFPKDMCLIMGNEAHGISGELNGLINRRIHIPSYGQAESLNVGVAAAIIIDNYRRST